MKRQEILNIILLNFTEIIPELEKEDIDLDETLIDLGANSIDRGELITLTLEMLELEVSRIEFVSAQTINELADLMSQQYEIAYKMSAV